MGEEPENLISRQLREMRRETAAFREEVSCFRADVTTVLATIEASLGRDKRPGRCPF
jgi:hypothetical protein